MNKQEIKTAIQEGKNFANDQRGWYTINKDGIMAIYFFEGYFTHSKKCDTVKYYKSLGAFTNRIQRLIELGY